ncbi:MAG: SDR family NAD(P)-dependent oxidoreductase [Ilumatobacter sp.]|uniref:SDR family NAD(P)-dependent oxidoreductase n=1 Tax=Ilumatobacter sp. TaxID=1967498 RepID=UPI00391D63F4
MTKNVIITGACGGIGRGAATAFTDAGWHVIGVDRSPPIEHLDVHEFVQADLAADDGISALRTQLAHVERLDALVNNAALQVNQPLVQTSDDEWAAVMNTNVRAAFQMIREFHSALAAVRGAVVNVSSVHAVATSMNVAVYAISKGALVALTRSAALELAAEGIRCNAVLPGAVMTPMLEAGLSRRPHPDGPDGNLNALIDRTPLGFVATPAQIAPTIIHLADTELSPYTTGQMMVVDGGATIRLGTE